ncbi:MAG: UDP-N-acetylmuramoyl-tripeptide--D-alanyl-D-alanine ligase [Methylococcaceae bacterium]
MTISLSELAESVQGRIVNSAELSLDAFSIDTRTLQAKQGYIAIQGERFDGHDFIEQAEQAGAAVVIVHKPVNTTLPTIIVDDTKLALAKLAGVWRERYQDLLVVGVTGSNGKTTTKEMLAAILDVHDEVLYTQGNLNNDIGVPLTLLRLNDQHRYAVIEMGANHPAEIAYTSRIANADVVIITNAGAAHLEGFGSIDGVAKAKGEIIETLKDSGTVIINHDDAHFNYWQQLAGQHHVLSFGEHQLADIRADNINITVYDNQFNTRFDLITPRGDIGVNLKLAGKHNILNALAASAASLALGIKPQQIAQGLATLIPVTGRLQPLLADNGTLIINDCYNANANSCKAALDVLKQCQGEHWMVLGAFGELGENSAIIHHQLGELIKATGVTRLFSIGELTQHTVAAFGDGANYYQNHDELITALKKELTGSQTLLIKGSRAQHLEQITSALVTDFRMY